MGKRLPTTSPTETAGLRWQPETWPMAKAMVSTVRPKARATPTKPIPRLGKAAARTALPQPPKTSQKVPKNSAAARFERCIVATCSFSNWISYNGEYDWKTGPELITELAGNANAGSTRVHFHRYGSAAFFW